jgi:hypothetical protein
MNPTPPALAPPPVSARLVVGHALGTYRRHFRVVAAVGAVLFAPLALIQALGGVAIHDGLAAGGGRRTGAVLLWLGLALFVLGSALCAGLLDKLVGREFGHPDESLRQAVLSLPYRRLVGEDLVLALLVGAATLLGAVPGLVALTLTCLAGPLVMIEDRTVRGALTRSVSLTWRRFWLVLGLVAVPIAVEHQVLHALEAWLGLPLLPLWLLHTAAAVLVVVPVVLVEVTLAYLLTGRSRGMASDAHEPAGGRGGSDASARGGSTTKRTSAL